MQISDPLDNNQTKKPRLFTLNFGLLFFSTLCVMIVFLSLNATLSAYLEAQSGTVKYAGLAVTALTAAAVLARPIAGFLLDKYGRKYIFFVGLAIFLLTTVSYVWMLPAAVLIIFRFIQGWGFGFAHTASNTIAMDLVPPERLGEGVGLYSISFSLSMAVGPAIALFIIERYTFKELFVVCAVLSALSIVLALFIKYPKITNKTRCEIPALHSEIKFKVIEKKALTPSLIGFLVMFPTSAVNAFLYLFSLNINLQSAGLFFTVMAVSTIISRPFAGMILDQAGYKGRSFNLIFSTFLLISSIVIVANTISVIHLLLGGFLFGLGSGFSKSTLIALTVLKAPESAKGRALATYWTFVDIGASVGAFLWGYTAALYGYRMMYLLAIIPLILAILVYYFSEMRRRQTA